MILKCLPTGMFESNCYVLGENGEGVVIDPGADSRDIIKAAGQNGLIIKYIILTHTHIDHICSVDRVREQTGARVMAHDADAGALADPLFNGSALFGESAAFKKADGFLKDGDIIETGGLRYEIIHTPGHSPGGICIKVGNCVFTGDTLFRMSIGRTDLGNGSYDDIIHSIKHRLTTLGDEVIVYPGHGASTTIGYERKNNPYI